jgi:hypothetical protein
LLFVTSVNANVDGTLAPWNLSTSGPAEATTNFRVATPYTWQLVVCSLDLLGIANALVRVEFYLSTAGAQLLIDNANLFRPLLSS